MRTAIYIDDGVTQLVLTPETATDRQVLDTIGAASAGQAPEHRFSSYRGEFYDCNGGWTRWASTHESGLYGLAGRDDELSKKSLILRVERVATKAAKSATIPDSIPSPSES